MRSKKAQHQRNHLHPSKKIVFVGQFRDLVQQQATGWNFLSWGLDLLFLTDLYRVPGRTLAFLGQPFERMDFRHGLYLVTWRHDHFVYRRGRHLSLKDFFGDQAAPLHHREADICTTKRLSYSAK